MNLVDNHIDKVRALCAKHSVGRLFVFGSVLTDRFSEKSDIDFLVEFKGVTHCNYADNYFDFKESLEHLFNRGIDLLENQAVNNPYLRQSIDSSKQLIY